MKAREIKKGIYWVGAIDWDVRNFHGYLTQRGTTYNAYLVIDEKITLIDTVKPGFEDEMIARIKDVIDPKDIDIVISNHVEMDHSGGLPRIMKLVPNATLVTCPNGEKGLNAHYKKDWDYKVVKTGDSISIGKRSLQFLLTPMVHWPDNMVAYMPEEKMLFSNDAFGQHYATSERFDDECKLDIILEEAKKYYANIVLPYDKPTTNALKATSELDIEMIVPSHGLIWRKNVKAILGEYLKWSKFEYTKKAVIVYDSMWKSTEKMAYAIQSAFEEKGYATRFCSLQANHMSDIMTDIIDAEYVCVGTPTLNKNIMPSVSAFLTYLRGLAPTNRKAIAFGSFGWGGQGIDQAQQYLEESKFDVVDVIKHKYIPSEEDLENIKNGVLEKI